MERRSLVDDSKSSDAALPVAPPAPHYVRALRRLFSRRVLVRAGVGALGAVVALGVVTWLGELGLFNLAYAKSIVPSLLSGFYVTVELIGYIVPLGFAIGLLVGWARTSHSTVLRGVGAVYVDFFRSLPPIGIIFFAFLIGSLELKSSVANPFLIHSIAIWLGATALAMHTAAYQAEILRAGILSVPAGQTEAAAAIGLPRVRSMFLVTLPQAFRVSLPALGNEFSSVIKDSSLLSVIGWLELSGLGLVQVYSGIRISIYAPIIIWLEVGVLYFVVTFALTVGVRAVEEWFKVPGMGASPT